jgi:NAD(P)-dependent dehydrogenase (short-subunit alcohol dehydrogenase family)
MDYPVVLITGALSGIGRATAAAFAKEGVRLVVSGHRVEARQSSPSTPWPQGPRSYYL